MIPFLRAGRDRSRRSGQQRLFCSSLPRARLAVEELESRYLARVGSSLGNLLPAVTSSWPA